MYGKNLNNGQLIPLIGLGGLKRQKMENIEEIVYYSIKDGIRLIETDPYLDNEEDIGNGIKKALKEDLVKREELFIIGKLGIYNKKDPENSLKKTLSNLKIDYLDLYLDQSITYNNYDKKIITLSIYELWPKMENLVYKGLTKSLGVCNYSIQALNNLMSFCKIKPVVNGIQFHPYYYQKNMFYLCNKMNITLLSYFPLAKEYYEDLFIDEKYSKHFFKNLVNKYEKSSEQIILNWHKQLGTIPIVTTSLINISEENLNALNFELEKEDIDKISSLKKKIKIKDNNKIFSF